MGAYMPRNNFMSTVRKLFLLLGVVALAALAGCASPQAGRNQADLTAVQWELVKWSLQPMPPVGVRPIMLRFDQRGDEGRVSGHAGCNQFSAPYVLRDPGEITIATPVATRMACAPEVMEFEARLLDKLESISTYKITGKNMDLIAADGHVLSFRARPKVGAEASIKFIYVAPRQVACSTGAAQNPNQPQALCYQVRENKDEPWRLWSGGIAGFDFEPGTAYRLRILEERVVPSVAGAANVKWTLDLIVDQKTIDHPQK
jgi:heat shock protein HslJ